MESQRWSFCHHHGGGRLLVDLLDARDHGESKILHGGDRLLVDLKDAHENAKHKMELCHHRGFRRRTHLT